MSEHVAIEVEGIDRLSSAVLGWLTRSYDAHQVWKKRARDVFMASNGDSVLSRTRVAAIVRRYFLEERPASEDVEQWSKGYGGSVQVQVVAPKVSASNASYLDWLFVADYLLLSCAAETEEYQEENQRRETEFQQLLGSYHLRSIIHESRELMAAKPEMDDGEILELLKKGHPKASLANVKEGRRLESQGASRLKPLEPARPDPLPLYKSVHFPSKAGGSV